jgi:glycosyltransferase involved in cell wall biosynthesis
MGRGALVLYRDTPENAEVAGDAGIPFDFPDLPRVMERVLGMSEAERDELRRKAMARAREKYSWDAVTDAYERLLVGMKRR